MRSPDFFDRNGSAGGLFVLLSLFCLWTVAANATPSSDPLPRRPFLGVTAETVAGNHIRISKIIPDSPAARLSWR